ncbi:MAG TPA: acetolactate synthase small subunit [bacterium]|nr:acetolactate synthase small subunit [bacterium]
MSEAHTATISVLVENAPGVLVRVAGLIRRRGVNIHSLSVGPTENAAVSRMTIVVDTPPERTEQFAKQLRKLVEVRRATAVDGQQTVDRELALVKVNATPGTRMEIMEIANVFRANVVDLTDRTMTLEVTGKGEKVDAIVSLLAKHGIREIARTGQATLVRGAQAT